MSITIGLAVIAGFAAGFLWTLYELRNLFPDLYAALRERVFDEKED